jgi:tRNA A-37 threonylcarbamoyl transferase component Bud32
VPKVVAVGERRKFGGLVDAFIMTQGVPKSETLEEYAKTHPQRGEAFREIFRQLVEIVRKMHAAGFYHIDLQWRNVLIQNGENRGNVKVFLIDCPRGGRRLWTLSRWNGKMHDLAGLEKLGRVYLSSKERLGWFKMYNGGRKFNRADRAMIKAIRKQLGKKERSDN